MTLPRNTPAEAPGVNAAGDPEIDWTIHAVVVVDSRGIVRLSNRSAEDLFGYTSDEMESRPVKTFIHGRVKAGSSHAAGVRKDGSEFPVGISLCSIASEDGLLMLAVLSDLSTEAETRTHFGRTVPLVITPEDNAHRVNNVLAGIANYASLATANLHREILRGELGGCEDFSSILADLGRISQASKAAVLLVTSAAAPSNVPDHQGRTVLLVDDDADVRDSTKRLLEMEGYAVLEARDAQTALALSTAHHGTIDVLLTDYALAGGNGHDLEAAMGNIRPDAKVLFMTGYDSESLRREHPTITAGTLIRKPFSADGLYRKLAEVLVADR